MRYLICLLAFILTSCIESNIESFTNPDYKEAKFSRIILDTSSLSEQVRIEATKEIIERLKEAKYEVVDIYQVINPTKQYSTEDIRKLIAESGYDSVLRFVVTSDSSKSEVAGYYTSANTYGNAYGNNVYANSQAVAIPIVASNGVTTTTAYVHDAKNLNVAWQANILTKASGTAFVGNIQALASNIAGKVIEQWKLDGH